MKANKRYNPDWEEAKSMLLLFLIFVVILIGYVIIEGILG